MKEILLIGPDGKRWIREGEPFRFLEGESVAEDKEGNSIIKNGNDLYSLRSDEGLLIGNIIKRFTSTLGIKQCLKCKKRQLRYNQRGLEVQSRIKKLVGL